MTAQDYIALTTFFACAIIGLSVIIVASIHAAVALLRWAWARLDNWIFDRR